MRALIGKNLVLKLGEKEQIVCEQRGVEVCDILQHRIQ